MVVGTTEPPLSWQLTAGSLVGADAVTGDLTRQPGGSPGIYAILQGSLTASANYDLTYLPGFFTITPWTDPPAPSPLPPVPTRQDIALITTLTPPNRFVQTGASSPYVWLGAATYGNSAQQEEGDADAADVMACLGGAGAVGCGYVPHPSNLTYGRALTFRVRQ